MRYKSDWEEAAERYAYMWNGEMLDRPCIDIRAPLDVAAPDIPEPVDAEARWTDADYRLSALRREMLSTWYGGEAIPGGMTMAGWLNCLGGDLQFDDRTIWFDQRVVDFNRPSPFRHDPQSRWSRQLIRMHDAYLDEAGWDAFLVGTPKGLNANDLLSMIIFWFNHGKYININDLDTTILLKSALAAFFGGCFRLLRKSAGNYRFRRWIEMK